MISSDVIRGYTDTMVLFLLLDEPSYGYEISRRIRERTQDRYVMKETTLYSTFNRLESEGYVSSFYGTETSGNRRTYYRITPKGEAYYEEKKQEWELTKDVIQNFIRN